MTINGAHRVYHKRNTIVGTVEYTHKADRSINAKMRKFYPYAAMPMLLQSAQKRYHRYVFLSKKEKKNPHMVSGWRHVLSVNQIVKISTTIITQARRNCTTRSHSYGINLSSIHP